MCDINFYDISDEMCRIRKYASLFDVDSVIFKCYTINGESTITNRKRGFKMFFREHNIFKSEGTNHYRIPSIMVDNDGNVIAFCNNRKNSIEDHVEEADLVCCVRDAETEKWGDVKTICSEEKIACTIGNAIYDKETGEGMCFVMYNLAFKEFGMITPEERAELDERREKYGKKCGAFIMSTRDGGKTFEKRSFDSDRITLNHIDGNEVSVAGSGHGSCPGIQLKHGEHKGRLLVPTRVFTGRSNNGLSDLKDICLNNSIYSDDHGKTWKNSRPVQRGTGEGTLMECRDGSIYYNSRAYFFDAKRRIAHSYDGGESYTDYSVDEFLLEEIKCGCNAALLHIDIEQMKDSDKALLPDGAQSVTIFTNPRSILGFGMRCNMTACYSFDEGKTWSGTKCIWGGGASYSAMCYCEKTGRVHMLYEKGNGDCCEFGLSACEFDLDWLLSK